MIDPENMKKKPLFVDGPIFPHTDVDSLWDQCDQESLLMDTPAVDSVYSESSIFGNEMDSRFRSLFTVDENQEKAEPMPAIESELDSSHCGNSQGLAGTPPVDSFFTDEDSSLEQDGQKESQLALESILWPVPNYEDDIPGGLPLYDFESETGNTPSQWGIDDSDSTQQEGSAPPVPVSIDKSTTADTSSPPDTSDHPSNNTDHQNKGKVNNMSQEEIKVTLNDDLWKDTSGTSADWSEYFGGSGGGISLDETPPAIETTSSVANNRQILNLLFMIDVSGSMRGQRIGMVNYALENIFKELKSRDETNAVIKVGILEFSEDAKWVTPQPVALDHFVFTKVDAQPWLTNFGPAFDMLGSKLSRKAFMNPDIGEYFAPVILFVTDGEPTDVTEYPYALERLSKNGWFCQSAKYAIAVGEEARTAEVARLLSCFTGDINNVRYADEGEALCSLIQYVAIRASQVQTSMVSSGTSGSHQNGLFDDEDPNFSSLLNP